MVIAASLVDEFFLYSNWHSKIDYGGLFRGKLFTLPSWKQQQERPSWLSLVQASC
jgi:hypothetical protein